MHECISCSGFTNESLLRNVWLAINNKRFKVTDDKACWLSRAGRHRTFRNVDEASLLSACIHHGPDRPSPLDLFLLPPSLSYPSTSPSASSTKTDLTPTRRPRFIPSELFFDLSLLVACYKYPGTTFPLLSSCQEKKPRWLFPHALQPTSKGKASRFASYSKKDRSSDVELFGQAWRLNFSSDESDHSSWSRELRRFEFRRRNNGWKLWNYEKDKDCSNFQSIFLYLVYFNLYFFIDLLFSTRIKHESIELNLSPRKDHSHSTQQRFLSSRQPRSLR